LDDRELAALAARGDRRALTALIERYRGYLYAIAYRVTLDEDDALDATQIVYARIVERIGEYRGEGSLKGWLGAIAARTAIDAARRRNRRRETAVDPILLGALADRAPIDGAGAAREAIEREQRLAMVEAAMADLPPQQRAIVALRLSEGGMKNAEIAERLELPAAQVRSQLARAVAKLRAWMSEIERGRDGSERAESDRAGIAAKEKR
jgi:RNA polymerase sigma-70 factor (ECF subfamily)